MIAHRRWQTTRIWGALVGAVLCCAATSVHPVSAQELIDPDDVDAVVVEPQFFVVRNGNAVLEARVIILGNDGRVIVKDTTPHQRERFEQTLAERILALDAGCSLSDIQKRKLSLAGRGDIKQYYDRQDENVRKMRAQLPPDLPPDAIAALVQSEMRDFDAAQARNDLFGEDSLFQKTVRGILTPEQLARAAQSAMESRIAALIESWDKRTPGITLTPENRHRLAWLVATNGPVVPLQNRNAYHVMLLQLAYLEDEVRPLFSRDEWPALAAELRDARTLEPYLRKIGEWPRPPHDPAKSDRPSKD